MSDNQAADALQAVGGDTMWTAVTGRVGGGIESVLSALRGVTSVAVSRPPPLATSYPSGDPAPRLILVALTVEPTVAEAELRARVRGALPDTASWVGTGRLESILTAFRGVRSVAVSRLPAPDPPAPSTRAMVAGPNQSQRPDPEVVIVAMAVDPTVAEGDFP